VTARVVGWRHLSWMVGKVNAKYRYVITWTHPEGETTISGLATMADILVIKKDLRGRGREITHFTYK
jgi:hypothetical protein